MNLPNAITLLRILLVPALVWVLLVHNLNEALWIFLLAGLSDALDGFIAKRFHLTTRLGSFLDPAADKLLLVSSFICLAYLGLVPVWLALIVCFRDLLIVGGAITWQMLFGNLSMEPIFISKVNTFFQILYILAILWQAIDHHQGGLADILAWTVATTTLVSGIAYVFTWSRKAAATENAELTPS